MELSRKTVEHVKSEGSDVIQSQSPILSRRLCSSYRSSESDRSQESGRPTAKSVSQPLRGSFAARQGAGRSGGRAKSADIDKLLYTLINHKSLPQAILSAKTSLLANQYRRIVRYVMPYQTGCHQIIASLQSWPSLCTNVSLSRSSAANSQEVSLSLRRNWTLGTSTMFQRSPSSLSS